MAQNETIREPVDIWFSFRSEDLPYVEQILDIVEKEDDRFFEESLHQYINIPKDFFFRLVPKCYLREEDDRKHKSKYQYLGSNVGDFVINIANSLLKILVINQGYFKKSACMQELCFCLCSNHTQEDLFPALLALDEHVLNILSGEKIEFAISANQESATDKERNCYYETTTIYHALKKTHDYLREKYGVSLPGFHLEEVDAGFFKEKLDELRSRVFVSSQAGQREVAASIFQFAMNVINKHRVANWQVYLHDRYKELSNTWYLKRIFNHIESKGGASVESKFLAIASSKDVVLFLESIEKSIKSDAQKIESDDAKDFISELCSIAMMKSLNPLNASLLPHMGKIDGMLQVNVTDDSKIKLHQKLLASFAYSVAKSKTVKFDTEMNHKAIDLGGLDGVVTTQFRLGTPNEANDGKVYSLIKNLVYYYAPDLLPNLPNTLDKVEKDTFFLKEFRDEISFRKTRGEDVVILLNAKDRGVNGDHDALNHLYRIINGSSQDNLFFPVVELIMVSESIGKEKISVLFTEESYGSFKRVLREIFKYFKVKEPA